MKKKLSILLVIAILCVTFNLPYITYADAYEDEDLIQMEPNVDEINISVKEIDININLRTLIASFTYSIKTLMFNDSISTTFSILPPSKASEIGIKNIYLRYKPTSSSIYQSQAVASVAAYNRDAYTSIFTIGNPTSKMSYRYVGTIYVVINGITSEEAFDTGWMDYPY